MLRYIVHLPCTLEHIPAAVSERIPLGRAMGECIGIVSLWGAGDDAEGLFCGYGARVIARVERGARRLNATRSAPARRCSESSAFVRLTAARPSRGAGALPP
jgi:hypothetical protein